MTSLFKTYRAGNHADIIGIWFPALLFPHLYIYDSIRFMMSLKKASLTFSKSALS